MAACAEEVKAAVGTGTVTVSTATALAGLLGLDDHTSQAPDKVAGPQAAGPDAKSSAVRTSKPAAARSKKPVAAAVREYPFKALSGRDKYALATHTVNHGLKMLSSSSNSRQNAQKSASPEKVASPRKSDANPHRALQPRSGNISPVRSSPKKESIDAKLSAASLLTDVSNEGALNVQAIAQCTQHGFTFLLNGDCQALGVREMPQWQLENGLLAFVGSLTSHGLDKLAIKNLRILKRRLEARSGTKGVPNGKNASRIHPKIVEMESITSLLHLHCTLGDDPAALSVAIAYYQHAIKLMFRSPTSTILQALPTQVAVELPNGPVDFIIRHAKATKDASKAAKQLEALSQVLLRFGPNATQSPDEIQSKSCHEGVLRLRTIGLQIRKLWWKLAKHQADLSRELLQPFFKSAQAFVQRQTSDLAGHNRSELLATCFKSIGPFDPEAHGTDLFVIHNLLCSQAQSENKLEEARSWAKLMAQDCSTLDQSHARSIAAYLRKITCLSLEMSVTNDADTAAAEAGLQSKLTGSVADYEALVGAISSLSQASLDRRKQMSGSMILTRLLLLGATFCQRYARSYPGRNTQEIVSIVNTSLRLSPTTDDLVSWIARDSASVFIEAGALKGVGELAATRPLLEVWSASRDTLSLSRILNTLLVKAVRSNADIASISIFDDEKLESASRGILLEWQLQCAADLVSRIKYHDSLKKIIPEILRKLTRVYEHSDFPIRRTRSATIALGIREAHPSLLPPHVLKIWQDSVDIQASGLGQDAGLVNYLDDITARHAMFKLFSAGQPSIDELRPNLHTWRGIILKCDNRRALHDSIDEPATLRQQLKSIAAYLRMLGDDGEAISVNLLLVKLDRLLDPVSEQTCISSMELARNYLHLGYSDKSAEILEQYECTEQQPKTVTLQCKALQAEYLLSTDQLCKCSTVMDEVSSFGSGISFETLPREQRRLWEVLCAESWFISSRLYLSMGRARESLHAGKRAVQILNGIWSSLERATGFAGIPEPSSEADKAINGLAKGISKLQLTPTENDKNGSSDQQSKRGAAFWPVVPVLIKALLHLSDVYTHHGLFNEADYYSQRAVAIAESVGSTILLSRVRSHRCRLLTLAGRLEGAEMCIVQDGQIILDSTSLAKIERICARAGIKVKEGDQPTALRLYEQAETLIEEINSVEFLVSLENFTIDEDELSKAMNALNIREHSSADNTMQLSKTVGRRPAKTTSAKAPTAQRGPSKALAQAKNQQAALYWNHPLMKVRHRVAVEKALTSLQLGDSGNAASKTELQVDGRMLDASSAQLLRHRSLVNQATDTLETNVTLGLLAESTLSCPGLMNVDKQVVQLPNKSATAPRSRATGKTGAKAKAQGVQVQDGPEAMLVAARNCLSKDMAAKLHTESTVNAHTSYSLLSNVSLLASAFATNETNSSATAVSEAMSIDYPRIRALELEQSTISNDAERIDDARHMTWPEISNISQPLSSSHTDFQRDFINILPTPWTAVSLCLSEDGKNLFIARYRAGNAPFTLKLPFARHKPGDDNDVDEPAFDYHKGKAELQDIIETSNYTCHNPGNLDAKGAKSKWWKEREDLDRRLHELLINIENIWLGGFKSIFATQAILREPLAQFRTSLEQILARYLPSRIAKSETIRNLALDDQVLGLFVGLGKTSSTAIDIEEQVTDLLYFVVDLLQFRGERNAYDEIDFDSMTIDVVDAIHTYHEAPRQEIASSQHLILVLDRRLQSFPWESLPCLESCSVSRVGSMLSLRHCILAMRQPHLAETKSSTQVDGCHLVSRKSGTYILNPSSDLSATQTTLQPSLTALEKPMGNQWNPIVSRSPSEDEFSSALSKSSVTLYFGHGAGSQYIRPRTIKRLEQCSEVIWLMGCSSGAVWENGDLEPCAVPLSYLLAGGNPEGHRKSGSICGAKPTKCLSVVAALWDVTDKDIDRFSLAIGEYWGLWPASAESKLPTKTPRKREIVAQPSTPVQVPKTPKTPKTRKMPAIAKTPATMRSRPRKDEGRKFSLVEAVARSRDVCTLRYLNGAAPVVYGVPVYLED